MPKLNDKVFCINHPEEEMIMHDIPFMLHSAELKEKKIYCGTTAHLGAIYVCSICGYIELYDAIDCYVKK